VHKKDRKPKRNVGRPGSKHIVVLSAGQLEAGEQAKREKYFDLFLAGAFLAFGIYLSILYFGHKIVPISDFPDIVRVGHDLLSFRLPVRFKQAPVVGILQAMLSHLVGGQNPDLNAGWLLNAILHPLNLMLFWLVAKKIVGRSAVWFALITIINHWVLYMLTEPIMETTLLFFSLVTFYFIFRRSYWAYVFASITTMVRYEGAALIMAVFVIDMIYSTDRRQRIRAFVYSVLATVPLALWLLGTILTWKAGETHYLEVFFSKEYAKGFAQPVEERTGIIRHIQLLWLVGFRPLLMPYPGAGEASVEMLVKLSKVIAMGGFLFGSIYGLCKRRWEILMLLLFFVPYFIVHARYPYPLQRFHSTIFWIALLLCLFGLQSIWRLIDKDNRIPRALIFAIQAAIAVIAIIWLVLLVRPMAQDSAISPKSASLPYVTIALTGLIFAGRLYIYKGRNFLREFSILTIVCLFIVCNQFTVISLLGDGQQDSEFKQLADWYISNAKPGEKMAVYMAGVVKMFAPKYAEYIVQPPKADDPDKFTQACYGQNITYLVWATREGLRANHTGYRQLGLDRNMEDLASPKSVGPYQFVQRVGSQRGYVNIFRLRTAPSGPDTTKPATGPP
jgi:hypothetical protein